jgi:hypothetical protein
MTYTFTLYITNENGDRLYAEYHNFREVGNDYVYYRGGSNHPLEIDLTKQSAIASMNKLFAVGWNCNHPKFIEV